MGADKLVGMLAPTEVKSEQEATNMNTPKHNNANRQMVKKKKKRWVGENEAKEGRQEACSPID